MLIPTGYAQVNYIFGGTAAPEGAQVTLGLRNTISDLTAAEIAAEAAGKWGAFILPLQSSSITLVEVLAKKGPNATGASAVEGVGEPGGAGATTEVPNVSVLVSKTTSEGGRAGRGRMYVPGVDQGLFDSAGNMSSGTQSTWDAAFASFQSSLISVDLVPYLLHGDGSPIATPTDIDTFVTQAKAATQRRRLRR